MNESACSLSREDATSTESAAPSQTAIDAILGGADLRVHVVERPVLAKPVYDHRFIIIQSERGYLYVELVAKKLLIPFAGLVQINVEVHVAGEPEGESGIYELTAWHNARGYRMSRPLFPVTGDVRAFAARILAVVRSFERLAAKRLRYTRGLFDGPGIVRARLRRRSTGDQFLLNSNHFVTLVLGAAGGLTGSAVATAIAGTRDCAAGSRDWEIGADVRSALDDALRS